MSTSPSSNKEGSGSGDGPPQKNGLPQNNILNPAPVTDEGDLELDNLLDEALKDFSKPLPEPKPKVKPEPSPSSSGVPGPDSQNWSEEFIREATAQFEKKMRECIQKGSTNPEEVAQSLNKVVESATKGVSGAGGISEDVFADSINQAIKNMSSNSSSTPQNPLENFNEDELSKLMGSFGMGDMGDGEMDDILPFMTNMMQKLLSKDLLQPVLVDIVDKYPEWLADHESTLSKPDFDKYTAQYENMKKICEEYANESEGDSEGVKAKRFDRISELMLKVQCSGPPPKELVGEDSTMDAFPPMEGMDKCSLM